MYLRHLSSLQFLTYAAFFAVVIAGIFRFMPGKAPPVRTRPYPDDELGAHDGRLGKYFVAGGAFLVLGALHMVAKNVPWAAEWLARAGYAGHLVRDLSNTHVMIVGGGTLVATGLCWYALPRVVGRPLASDGLAQCAFWLTAVGLLVFYVALVANGIAMGRLVAHGWDYELAKAHMGKLYKVPVGIGAGVMGLGYWCFAANVVLTIFQARLVRVPKPQHHLWKFFATGAVALTVGTVQGVIQVQPANARWLYTAGHAGEWIDPISHAHINLVTGLTMLVAGALFALAPRLGVEPPSRRVANACWASLLAGSLAFYGSALYVGFHEGHLVVRRGLTPERAEEATRIHPFLIMGAGVLMFAAFWFLLGVIVRVFRRSPHPARPFVLAGCAALALGTLQGPLQAFPAVNEALDGGGAAGDEVVNLHAQLNMLGGLMPILIGLALTLLARPGLSWPERGARRTLRLAAPGVLAYYYVGLAAALVEARSVVDGRSFAGAVTRLEPWLALLLLPAALAILAGFGAFAAAAWRLTGGQRAETRRALAGAPRAFSGPRPSRVRRRRPAAVAAYEVPMGLLGFPGLGWLFAGFPLTGAILLMCGPAVAWAVLPAAFTPFGDGPLRGPGWRLEFVWLPASTLLSTALLYRAHRRRRLRLLPPRPPRGGRRRAYRTRVGVAVGTIALVLVSLPFLPAVTGIARSSVRYSYEPRASREVTGQFLVTPRGTVKLFAWQDPQSPYPRDALRVHAGDVDSLIARAAAVDDPAAYRLFDLNRGRPVALTARGRSPRRLALAPARRLRPGRYVFLATHEGMFGGRDFAYLTVVPPGAATTPIRVAGRDAAAPAVVHALLPVATTLVALAFASLLLRSFRRRPAGQKALWAGGFLLFAAAAAAEALAQRSGWSPALFRVYYLCGGVLTVAYLGAGSAWLLLRPRARDLLLGGLLVATGAAAAAVAVAPADAAALAATASGHPPPNGALGGHAFVWAIVLNGSGTLSLVGGALLSVLRRRRVRTNLWIGGGACVVALATGLSRTGDTSLVYLGELVGISLMFAGFTVAGDSPPRRLPAAAPRLERTAAAQ